MKGWENFKKIITSDRGTVKIIKFLLYKNYLPRKKSETFSEWVVYMEDLMVCETNTLTNIKIKKIQLILKSLCTLKSSFSIF